MQDSTCSSKQLVFSPSFILKSFSDIYCTSMGSIYFFSYSWSSRGRKKFRAYVIRCYSSVTCRDVRVSHLRTFFTTLFINVDRFLSSIFSEESQQKQVSYVPVPWSRSVINQTFFLVMNFKKLNLIWYQFMRLTALFHPGGILSISSCSLLS